MLFGGLCLFVGFIKQNVYVNSIINPVLFLFVVFLFFTPPHALCKSLDL